MNFFKKLFRKNKKIELSEPKDPESFDNKQDVQVTVKDKEPVITQEEEKEISPIEEAKDIYQLEEYTKKAIGRLRGTTATINKLIFHTKNQQGHEHSQQARHMLDNTNFISQIKNSLEYNEIKYSENFSCEINFYSSQFHDHTQITQTLAFEVQTLAEISKQTKARITALSGVMFEEEYILEPREKPYYIGRGENPKLANGRFLKNDIAFKEKDENGNKIDLNFNISRSLLMITYDFDRNVFEISRTGFMFKDKFDVKVDRLTDTNYKKLKLDMIDKKVKLLDGDQIIVNGEVSMLFEIV